MANRIAIVVLAIAVVAAGLAAGIYFNRSRSLEERLTAASGELEQTKIELKRLQEALEQSKAELARAREVLDRKPPMPIQITTRRAFLGEGLVLTFRNNSARMLAVEVKLTNPTFNKTRTFELVINPGLVKEISYAEGWPGASGDLVEVMHQDYDTLKATIP